MSIPQGTDAGTPPIVPGPSRTAYVGLGVAAVLLGVATAVGVWLFNEAFGLVHRVVLDGAADALAPLGAWTLIPIVAAAGVVVALIVRFMRPEPLGALPHVIDGVVEHEGRLNGHNAAVAISGAAAGIGFGMPLGADTPSAMIGAHLASSVATRLRWPTAFVQALVVAGVRSVSASARTSKVASGMVAPPNRSFIVAVPVPMTSGSQIATRPTSAPAMTIRPIGGSGTRPQIGFDRRSKAT